LRGKEGKKVSFWPNKQAPKEREEEKKKKVSIFTPERKERKKIKRAGAPVTRDKGKRKEAVCLAEKYGGHQKKGVGKKSCPFLFCFRREKRMRLSVFTEKERVSDARGSRPQRAKLQKKKGDRLLFLLRGKKREKEDPLLDRTALSKRQEKKREEIEIITLGP